MRFCKCTDLSLILQKSFNTSVQSIPQPFTNLQLELLKVYALKVNDEDLKEIKTLLAQYFMDKASDLADEIWEQKGLSEEAILGEHRRTQMRK